MENTIQIDEFGYVNGIDPTDWLALATARVRMSEEQRNLANQRWFSPSLIAIRQGMVPTLDLRHEWVKENERRQLNSDFDTNNPHGNVNHGAGIVQ